MYFSSAIIVAALTSSIYAIPVDTVGADKCPITCLGDGACKACHYQQCVSISILLDLTTTHLHDRFLFFAL
ncbi:hypothetical protein P692DRAFT_20739045 [Suillus brevipes Sb2]|nr:hypothetical protein P692DRAFT_20739045 [Suillus brevipes Sb2]